MAPKKKAPAATTKAAGPKRVVNLALQGGGAHGAFTWGVLDRLLEDEQLEIEAITSTGAGSMNAAIVVFGLLEGGRDMAKALLEEFWKKVSALTSFTPKQPGFFSPVQQPNFFDRILGTQDMGLSAGFMAFDFFTKMFSPYQYNMLDINPVRDILAQMVDFDVIADNTERQLFVNATNVRTGKPRVFKTEELTLDKVMASACMPFLFKAVEVDGQQYWDGGYSGNPALFPLFYHSESRDIIIVQATALNKDEAPTTASDILDRANEISFNTNLMHEVRAIEFVNRMLDQHRLDDKRYCYIRLHRIHAEDLLNDFGGASKLNADWDFLNHVRSIGYQAADDWLDMHRGKLGKSSSIDMAGTYL